MGPSPGWFDSSHSDHNCTLILIQWVSGLGCGYSFWKSCVTRDTRDSKAQESRLGSISRSAFPFPCPGLVLGRDLNRFFMGLSCFYWAIVLPLVRQKIRNAQCTVAFPSISFSVRPSFVFHVRGPLTGYPRTKLAAADELENKRSSVVTKSSTFPSANSLSRRAFIPGVNDLTDDF